MITKNISFKSFLNFNKSINNKLKEDLISLLEEKNQLFLSLGNKYIDSFNKRKISKFKKHNIIQIFGMGGSSLGAKAIYNFLKKK